MVNGRRFDSELWFALRRRDAQMQEMGDHQVYDDATYNEPGNALSTYEVRDEPQSEPYEQSEVTSNEPRSASVRVCAMPMPTQLPEGWQVFRTGDENFGKETMVYKLFTKEREVAAQLNLTRSNDDTWHVSWSKNSMPGGKGGWGAYLYELAMKELSRGGEWMMPDSVVSDEASRIWEKYRKRPDVESQRSRHFLDQVGDLNKPEFRSQFSQPYLWRRYRMKQGDIALMHPERYDDLPGYENGQMTSFFPVEQADEGSGAPEGEPRYEDKDGAQPLGRPSTTVPGLASDMLDGTLGTGDHDLENQTSYGFQEHEAEVGQTARTLTTQGVPDSPIGVSPSDPMDWMGRGAAVRVTARQRVQEGRSPEGY